MKRIHAADQLDALPVGSVILDVGDDYESADSPVIACKTPDGWHVTGDRPDRRWQAFEIIRDSVGVGAVLLCVWDTATPTEEADHG